MHAKFVIATVDTITNRQHHLQSYLFNLKLKVMIINPHLLSLYLFVQLQSSEYLNFKSLKSQQSTETNMHVVLCPRGNTPINSLSIETPLELNRTVSSHSIAQSSRGAAYKYNNLTILIVLAFL